MQKTKAADAEGDRVEPVPVQVAHREKAVALVGLGVRVRAGVVPHIRRPWP